MNLDKIVRLIPKFPFKGSQYYYRPIEGFIKTYDPPEDKRFLNPDSYLSSDYDLSIVRYFLRKIPPQYYTIPENKAYRPDLIALDIYDSTSYWWIIVIYADVRSFDDLAPGRILPYPPLTSVKRILKEIRKLYKYMKDK